MRINCDCDFRSRFLIHQNIKKPNIKRVATICAIHDTFGYDRLTGELVVEYNWKPDAVSIRMFNRKYPNVRVFTIRSEAYAA